ncbi:MAG: hypothetical protein ABR506_05315 [Candidatus Krumholzibacteriia bacterium]
MARRPGRERRLLLLAVGAWLAAGLGAAAAAADPAQAFADPPAAADTDSAGLAPASADASAAAVLLTEREFHLVPGGAAPLQLAYGFVDAASVKVIVDGRPWLADLDFKVRTRTGTVVPLRPWRAQTAPPGAPPVVVIVVYRFLPVPVVPRRDLRPVAPPPERDPRTGAPLFTAPADEVWGSGDLKVTGSKTVQVASGSRRELTVDQNLRLTLAGQLTRDIAVRAFLSDDNLPVVPEGNTEELRDIDKVLVELRARRWAATLGDFVAERRGSVFGDYRRKLQGISVQAAPGPARAEVLAGSPRGRYRTLQIRGQESNQGPYFLGGGSAGTNLFVVAGSERVTLDGRPLVRGADRDYVIDYVRGTVTFTYRRLVTAESTIVVEFEEGEGPYGRTVVGAGAGASAALPVGGAAGSLDVRIVREKDDPQRLRTGELGEDDEAVLRAAGDDPLRAVAPGALPAAPGEGLYVRRVQDGKTIYVHEPAGGDWNLEAYYAGPGLGDYDLERLTEAGRRIYVHRGDGLGAYRLGRPLALPESRSVMTMRAALGDSTAAHLRAEWDVSDHDRNLLSALDDQDNQGQAVALAAAMPRQRLAGGEAELGAFYTSRQAAFRGFQLTKSVFAYDDWGLADRARRAGFLEEGEKEAGFTAAWHLGAARRALSVTGDGGTLRHGGAVRARRLRGGAAWRLQGGEGDHRVLAADARDDADPLDVARRSQRHAVAWNVGPVRPSARWQQESWEDARAPVGRAAGYRLERWAWGLATAGGGLDWRAEFERGLADSLQAGRWQRQRDSRTATAAVTTGRFAGMRLVGEATLRRTERPRGATESTRLARLDLSGVWARTASDWSLGYRVDNSRAEVLTRQILFVGEGQGNYDADGDYLGPGQGDHDVALAGTDSLVATTAVRADLHWRQGFRFLGPERWYGAWTVTTTGGVEGRSTTDDVGGLLALRPRVLFDRDEAVLTDIVLAQEVAVLQHLRTIDLRGKLDFRETLDRQYADRPEDRLARGWQAIGTVNVNAVSSLRLRWTREQEDRTSAESGLSTRRSYRALTRRYEAGWTWRPDADLRLGLQGELLRRRDGVSDVSQRETALRPTGRHRFLRTWTAQADLRLADVVSDEPTGVLRPWFFPQPGRNVESSLRVAWEPNEFLTVSATWFARKQGERRWQHDVRLESTARF